MCGEPPTSFGLPWSSSGRYLTKKNTIMTMSQMCNNGVKVQILKWY